MNKFREHIIFSKKD